MSDATDNPNVIVPVGTQVVTRIELRAREGQLDRPKGALAEVVKSPVDNFHSYRVRFVDGEEASLHRREFAVWREHQRAEATGAPPGDLELYRRHIIYRCVVGSRAYGLEQADSDTDRRGIFLPPADLQWSLHGVPEQLEEDATQECYWELQKFLVMALKANPNVLECLWTPLVEEAKPIAQELLAMRAIFLSKLIYPSYNGYVRSQFKKIEQDRRARGQGRWKHAMHLVRLLLAAKGALERQEIQVQVGEHRERLLAIKRGETSWQEIDAWRLALHAELDAAYARTTLPERPDTERANAFLVRARRSMT